MFRRLAKKLSGVILPDNIKKILSSADIEGSTYSVQEDNHYYYVLLEGDHIEWEHLDILIEEDIEFKMMVKENKLTIAILKET